MQKYGLNVYREEIYRGHTGKRRPVTVWPDGSITEIKERDWPPTVAGYRATLEVITEEIVPEPDEVTGEQERPYWVAAITIRDYVTGEIVAEYERNYYRVRRDNTAMKQANDDGYDRAISIGYREVIPHRSTEVIKNDR